MSGRASNPFLRDCASFSGAGLVFSLALDGRSRDFVRLLSWQFDAEDEKKTNWKIRNSNYGKKNLGSLAYYTATEIIFMGIGFAPTRVVPVRLMSSIFLAAVLCAGGSPIILDD